MTKQRDKGRFPPAMRLARFPTNLEAYACFHADLDESVRALACPIC